MFVDRPYHGEGLVPTLHPFRRGSTPLLCQLLRYRRGRLHVLRTPDLEYGRALGGKNAARFCFSYQSLCHAYPARSPSGTVAGPYPDGADLRARPAPPDPPPVARPAPGSVPRVLPGAGALEARVEAGRDPPPVPPVLRGQRNEPRVHPRGRRSTGAGPGGCGIPARVVARASGAGDDPVSPQFAERGLHVCRRAAAGGPHRSAAR